MCVLNPLRNLFSVQLQKINHPGKRLILHEVSTYNEVTMTSPVAETLPLEMIGKC